MAIIMLILTIVFFFAMSTFVNRQQRKMINQQREAAEAAAVPGTWVRTRAGFYGKVVEVDGDVVTLATPLGDESLWAKDSLVGAEEPPFASTQEDEEIIEAEIVEGDDASEYSADEQADATDKTGEASEAADSPDNSEPPTN